MRPRMVYLIWGFLNIKAVFSPALRPNGCAGSAGDSHLCGRKVAQEILYFLRYEGSPLLVPITNI